MLNTLPTLSLGTSILCAKCTDIEIYYDLRLILAFLSLECPLTTSIENIECNRRKKWIVPQYCKCFLFTPVVVRVDPQSSKPDLIHSGM